MKEMTPHLEGFDAIDALKITASAGEGATASSFYHLLPFPDYSANFLAKRSDQLTHHRKGTFKILKRLSRQVV
jgi:hypothetical protein